MFNSEDCKERRFVPWEVKEATFKNAMGIVGVHMISMITPLGPGYMLANACFSFNYLWTVTSLMRNAVTKMDLSADGKSVNLTFGRTNGKVVNVQIKDISKVQNERALVETYEESSMFPIRVGKSTYYLNGPGQEAIKNGEVFRAIINGQSIKL